MQKLTQQVYILPSFWENKLFFQGEKAYSHFSAYGFLPPPSSLIPFSPPTHSHTHILFPSYLPPPRSYLIPHPSLLLPYLSFLITHPLSLILHPSPLLPHTSSLICHPCSLTSPSLHSPFLPHPSPLNPPLSSLIHHPSSIPTAPLPLFPHHSPFIAHP